MTDANARRPWWNRRDFLKGTVAGAAGAYAMRWGLAEAADIPLEFDGSKFQLKAAEPNPKHGGVVRMGIPVRPPHFDLHQSGTIFNLGAMGCMFDNLIRRDPRDGGKTVIPDLAHSWQIAKDSKTYTFFLRQGVQFSDGAELTADDVKATFDRIAKPPQGITIPRSILFKAVDEINARDKYTVEFKLSEARPVNFMMSALASGFNVVLRKKTLEDNHYDLRKVQVYPGTGPRPGYQADPSAAIKEARALMAGAGQSGGIKGLDFMVRELAIFKLWSQAIQAMLKETLGIECNLRTVVDSVWFADCASGNYDLAIGGLVSALLDPSDYFNAWYGKNGPQNYSQWDDQEFQDLSAKIDREIDVEKRQELIRRAEAVLEQDPPLLPIGWERIHELWYNQVKGRNPRESFGIYDVVRHDTIWLDKA